jgi:two-component system, chemotaxis family, chemotaxis protein CheY
LAALIELTSFSGSRGERVRNLGFALLIVDDNPHMRTIVSYVARACGIGTIDEAGSGAEAFEKLRTRRYDCATVDLNMDPINGIEFVKMIRTSKDSPDPYLPIIVISAYSERSKVQAARDAGADEFLTKPVTAQSLLKRMEAVVYRRRPFVVTPFYVGPDRRRKADDDYRGTKRRKHDEADVKLEI